LRAEQASVRSQPAAREGPHQAVKYNLGQSVCTCRVAPWHPPTPVTQQTPGRVMCPMYYASPWGGISPHLCSPAAILRLGGLCPPGRIQLRLGVYVGVCVYACCTVYLCRRGMCALGCAGGSVCPCVVWREARVSVARPRRCGCCSLVGKWVEEVSSGLCPVGWTP